MQVARRRPLSRIKTTSSRGFTIVELLVVIVVIAILAAITIVAYRGISQRAIVASLSSDLDNASKQLKLAQINTGTFPTANDCSITPAPNTICLKASTNTTYQYTVNNSTTPPTFCLTVTNGSTSYFTTNDATPTAGGCPGHSVGGGTVITNLVKNPNFETNVNGTGTGGYGTGGVGNITRTNDGYGGGSATTMTWTTPATSGGATLYAATTNASSGIPISPGTTYTVSLWGQTSTAVSSALNIVETNNAGDQVANNTYSSVGVANTWTRYSTTLTAVANAANLSLGVRVPALAGTPTNFTIKIDNAMVTEGSTLYNYADPLTSPSSWVWNGTPFNSTSTGPAL